MSEPILTNNDAPNTWLVDLAGNIAVSDVGLALLARIETLHVPAFVSTEEASEWGSHLDARQHATLVDIQRTSSNAARGERDPQHMADLATQSQLIREAAEGFMEETAISRVTATTIGAGVITMSFAHHVDAAEMRSCLDQLTGFLGDMQPGFSLLTDLTNLVLMDPGCASDLGTIMELCNMRGIKTVIRVIPDSRKDIGFTLLSHLHYRPEVEVITVENLADAIPLLAA